jgi:catalase (peroxidase I)
MMLPTDMALIQDEAFLPIVKEYALDEAVFREDFSTYFGQLLTKGCPTQVQPDAAAPEVPPVTAEQELRDLPMHGSVERMKQVVSEKGPVDVNATEQHSGRTALHKAAFFWPCPCQFVHVWWHEQAV